MEYRLSELFQKRTDNPELELIVTVYNINPGMNEELLEGCRLLKEYMQFTTRIRENRKHMDLQAAVNKAVDDCIRDGILAEFLTAHRAEVIAMSIFEYDQEKHIRQEKEESWEDGYADGRKEGIKEGIKENQQRMLLLLQKMSLNDEMHLADKLQDEAFLTQMYEKYGV